MQIDFSQITLDTARLFVRQFEQADLNELHQICSADGVMQPAGGLQSTNIEMTRQMLNQLIDGKSTLALVLKSEGKVIGFVGFYEDTRIREVEGLQSLTAKEIDFVISKDHWGQGLATEAVQAIAKLCFCRLGLDALIGTHKQDNQRSKRVLQKCGFEYICPSPFFCQSDSLTHEGRMYILKKK